MRTRMMSMFFLLLTVALVFSGCNGGGGGSMNGGAVVEPPAPTPMQYTVDLMDLAVTIPADTTIPAGGMMTFGDVTLSCPAGGSACALMQDDEGNVTSTGAMVTARLSDEAMARMEEERMDMEKERMEMEAVETARIMGLTAAIADPDGDGDPNTPNGGLNKQKRPGRTTFDVTLAPDGIMTVGEEDILGKMDKGVDDQFEPSATEAVKITGWQGAIHERTVDNQQDQLVVYTDVEDPKDVSYMEYFTKAYNAEDPNSRPAIVMMITDAADADEDQKAGRFDDADNEGRLTFGTDAISEKDSGLFSIFRFESGKETELKFSNDTTNKKNEVSGTFAGIPGTYICTGGAECTATGNDKGRLTDLSVGWEFQPTDSGAQSKVQDVKLDLDYLAFGYWLQETEKADGSIAYGINTFASGSMPFDNNEISTLEGEATYNGKATGLYAFKEFIDGKGVPTDAGQFRADANLTASFGGNDVAVSNQFMIQGTIDNFVDEQGDDISGGGWSVRLGKADFNRDDAFQNDFSGTTTGDGDWSGQFFGPDNYVKEDTATTSVLEKDTLSYPSGVAGEFNAHLGNGHVIGAFGATQ